MQVLPPGRTGGPSRLFIMRPVATTLLMVAILLAGIIGYRFLPVSALPEVDYPTIQVVTLYPGASPDVVTSAITAPLERQFGQMSGLKQMSSQSSGGASVVTLQFQLTLPLDVAEQEVQAAINAATNLLPSDLPNPPVYSKVNPADPPIMTLAVTSSAIPMTQVEDMVETRVAQKISQVSGVGLVTLAGGQRPAVRVKLNAQAIAALGLTSETVRTAITSANVNSAKGSLDGPARAVTLSANDQMQSADYRLSERGADPARRCRQRRTRGRKQLARGMGQPAAGHRDERPAPAGGQHHRHRRQHSPDAAAAHREPAEIGEGAGPLRPDHQHPRLGARHPV